MKPIAPKLVSPFMTMEDIIFNPRNLHHISTISYLYDDKKIEFLVNIIYNDMVIDQLIIVCHDTLIGSYFLSRPTSYVEMDKDSPKHFSYLRRIFALIKNHTGMSLAEFMRYSPISEDITNVK